MGGQFTAHGDQGSGRGAGPASASGPVEERGTSAGTPGAGGARNWIRTRIVAATGLPSRVADAKRKPAEAARAADANGSAPSTTRADRTPPSASTVTIRTTTASPAPPSG